TTIGGHRRRPGGVADRRDGDGGRRRLRGRRRLPARPVEDLALVEELGSARAIAGVDGRVIEGGGVGGRLPAFAAPRERGGERGRAAITPPPDSSPGGCGRVPAWPNAGSSGSTAAGPSPIASAATPAAGPCGWPRSCPRIAPRSSGSGPCSGSPKARRFRRA